jgi:hypothetical protein
MTELTELVARLDVLKRRHAERDQRMHKVTKIRAGEYDTVAPGLFPADWPKGITANFIDVCARDLSEVLAPLPTFSCSTSNALDDGSRSKANKRTRIATYYTNASGLELQMFAGADRYISYGFLPFRVEANLTEQRPHIHLDDPRGAYPEFDRWGACVAYVKVWRRTAQDLARLFPEHMDYFIGRSPGGNSNGNRLVDLAQWEDADATYLFCPEGNGRLLATSPNPLGVCPVVVARRPSFDDELRGQFDDVLWVQLAKAKMAMLRLNATDQAVNAPIALPADVNQLAIGPNTVIRSNQARDIHRVQLEVPASIWAEDQALEKEIRLGARYPESRTGNVDASVITGRGVQALMGGFDTQVKTAQAVFANALQDVLSLCFQMDEKLWGDQQKEIQATENGQPYTIKYRPASDIKGEYGVDVSYGLMAGLDPNRALVWGLQALGAGLLSKQQVRKNLPVSMNVVQEEQIIDTEKMRESLLEGISAYAQAIPAFAQSGQDPSQIITSISTAITRRKAGDSIEDAASVAFKPPAPPPGAPAGAEAQPPEGGMPGQGPPPAGGPGGVQPGGEPQGVAPGQAGMGPGGRPDMNYLLAGLSASGKPNLAANVVRRQPA